MASVKKRTDRGGKVIWRAYYRDPSGRQRNKSFARKLDAERYLTAIESSKLIGSYIDPSLSKLTLGLWSQRWLEGQSHLKPSTRERYAGILREHIDPKWEHVKLPYRLVVLFLAYTGVRFGELAALRVGRLDFLRRRAAIVESVTPVNGVQTWGTPKGHERREVPIPGFLIGELAAHVTGRGRDDLVFPGVRGGGALRAPVFRRAAFDRAAASIGMPGLHPHELRHTAASLAIASGADVKVVQTMLGHASAAMTLDQYGHLFGDRLDEVADAMEVAREAAVAQVLPKSNVVDLDDVRGKVTGQ
jgi:integrase